MPSPKISTYREITPFVYSWRTPDIQKYDGWEKIGYTEQESADKRISQQASQLVARLRTLHRRVPASHHGQIPIDLCEVALRRF